MTIERYRARMLASIVIAAVLTIGAAACNQPGGPRTTTDQPPVDSGPHVTPDSPTDPLFPQPTVLPSD